jgi:hypothetical protein
MKARRLKFGKAEIAGRLDGKTAIPIGAAAAMRGAELTERAVIS